MDHRAAYEWPLPFSLPNSLTVNEMRDELALGPDHDVPIAGQGAYPRRSGNTLNRIWSPEKDYRFASFRPRISPNYRACTMIFIHALPSVVLLRHAIVLASLRGFW